MWHIYAKPNNPETCPILDLAIYLFSDICVMLEVKHKDREVEKEEETVTDRNGLLLPGGN